MSKSLIPVLNSRSASSALRISNWGASTYFAPLHAEGVDLSRRVKWLSHKLESRLFTPDEMMRIANRSTAAVSRNSSLCTASHITGSDATAMFVCCASSVDFSRATLLELLACLPPYQQRQLVCFFLQNPGIASSLQELQLPEIMDVTVSLHPLSFTDALSILESAQEFAPLPPSPAARTGREVLAPQLSASCIERCIEVVLLEMRSRTFTRRRDSSASAVSALCALRNRCWNVLVNAGRRHLTDAVLVKLLRDHQYELEALALQSTFRPLAEPPTSHIRFFNGGFGAEMLRVITGKEKLSLLNGHQGVDSLLPNTYSVPRFIVEYTRSVAILRHARQARHRGAKTLETALPTEYVGKDLSLLELCSHVQFDLREGSETTTRYLLSRCTKAEQAALALSACRGHMSVALALQGLSTIQSFDPAARCSVSFRGFKSVFSGAHGRSNVANASTTHINSYAPLRVVFDCSTRTAMEHMKQKGGGRTSRPTRKATLQSTWISRADTPGGDAAYVTSSFIEDIAQVSSSLADGRGAALRHVLLRSPTGSVSELVTRLSSLDDALVGECVTVLINSHRLADALDVLQKVSARGLAADTQIVVDVLTAVGERADASVLARATEFLSDMTASRASLILRAYVETLSEQSADASLERTEAVSRGPQKQRDEKLRAAVALLIAHHAGELPTVTDLLRSGRLATAAEWLSDRSGFRPQDAADVGASPPTASLSITLHIDAVFRVLTHALTHTSFEIDVFATTSHDQRTRWWAARSGLCQHVASLCSGTASSRLYRSGCAELWPLALNELRRGALSFGDANRAVRVVAAGCPYPERVAQCLKTYRHLLTSTPRLHVQNEYRITSSTTHLRRAEVGERAAALTIAFVCETLTARGYGDMVEALLPVADDVLPPLLRSVKANARLSSHENTAFYAAQLDDALRALDEEGHQVQRHARHYSCRRRRPSRRCRQQAFRTVAGPAQRQTSLPKSLWQLIQSNKSISEAFAFLCRS